MRISIAVSEEQFKKLVMGLMAHHVNQVLDKASLFYGKTTLENLSREEIMKEVEFSEDSNRISYPDPLLAKKFENTSGNAVVMICQYQYQEAGEEVDKTFIINYSGRRAGAAILRKYLCEEEWEILNSETSRPDVPIFANCLDFDEEEKELNSGIL
jgi:hypothetical protein